MHPDPAGLAAAGQVALRYAGPQPERLGRRHRRRVRRDRGRARPDAAPGEPRPRPPAPAPPPRPGDDPARSGCACSKRRSAMSSERLTTSTPFVDIDLPLPDRRDGKVRVSYALGDRPAAVRHHRPAVGVRPDHRRRAVQGPGAQPAGGVVVRAAPPTSSPTTSSPCPTRTCSIARPPTPLPVEVVVRGYITGVTSTSLWKPYADGARDDLRLPLPRRPAQEHAAARADRHADDEAAGRLDGPRRAADVRRGRRARARRRRDAGSSVTAVALELFRRGPGASPPTPG